MFEPVLEPGPGGEGPLVRGSSAGKIKEKYYVSNIAKHREFLKSAAAGERFERICTNTPPPAKKIPKAAAIAVAKDFIYEKCHGK